MFAIGHLYIGKYLVYISTPVFCKLPDYHAGVVDLPYFEVCVNEIKWYGNHEYHFAYYVNLAKSPEFKFIFGFDKRNEPTDESDKIVTSYLDKNNEPKEHITYPEHESYVTRKEMSQPTWKLSKKSVERLLAKCLELEKASL